MGSVAVAMALVSEAERSCRPELMTVMVMTAVTAPFGLGRRRRAVQVAKN